MQCSNLHYGLSFNLFIAIVYEIRSQNCKKSDHAVRERHLLRIPNGQPRNDWVDKTKLQYHIPHFKFSQSKFRVIYDAVREFRITSLNELNQGSIFMQPLRAILIRFEEKKHGIAGDISNMFFQIRVAPDDRDMFRILWFSGDSREGEVTAYQFQAAPYGLRCISSIVGYAMTFTAQENILKAFKNTSL